MSVLALGSSAGKAGQKRLTLPDDSDGTRRLPDYDAVSWLHAIVLAPSPPLNDKGGNAGERPDRIGLTGSAKPDWLEPESMGWV